MLALLLAAVFLFCALAGGSSAKADASDFLVRTGGNFGFGDYPESSGPYVSDPQGLRDAFGAPSRVEHTGYRQCEMAWSNLGLRVSLAAFGSETRACSHGSFISALLTDRRWHTPDRVRVGSTRRSARRKADIVCSGRSFTARYYCPMAGFIYGTHQSECASQRSPNVIARTSRRRVVALIVFSHACE